MNHATSTPLVQTGLQERGFEQCNCSVVIRLDRTWLFWWQLEHTIESSEKVGIVVVDQLAHLEAGVAQRANKLLAIGESGTNLGELEYSARLEHTPRFTQKSRPIGAHERETEDDHIDTGIGEGHVSKVSGLNVTSCISNQIKRANLHSTFAASELERGGQRRLAAPEIGNNHRRVAMATPNQERHFIRNAIERIERPLGHLVAVGGVIRLKRVRFPLVPRQGGAAGLFVQLFVQQAELPAGQLAPQLVKERDGSA